MSENGRIISVLLLVLFIVFLPYWIYVSALIAAVFYFPFFWEGILLGLLIDILYGGADERWLLSFPFALGVTAAIIILPRIKSRLRLNV